MKISGNLLKHLSLIGCIAAICVLLVPAVSAEIIIPAPYLVGQGQEPLIGGTIPGSLNTPIAVIPTSFPASAGNSIISYPTVIPYPVNPAINLPATPGEGSGTQVFGAYYTGSGTGPVGFGSTGARYMCSF